MTSEVPEPSETRLQLGIARDDARQYFSAGNQYFYGNSREELEFAPTDIGTLTCAEQAFAEPDGFLDVQKRLDRLGIVVLMGPVHTGRRAAAYRLLRSAPPPQQPPWSEAASPVQAVPAADSAHRDWTVGELTPDWIKPNTQDIPRFPRHGFLLDLTGADEPMPNRFGRMLSSLGKDLLRQEARLVLIATKETWSQCESETTDMTVSWLPPSGVRVAEQWLKYRRPDLTWLVADNPEIPDGLVLRRTALLAALSDQTAPGDAKMLANQLADLDDLTDAEAFAQILDRFQQWAGFLARHFGDDNADSMQRALLLAAATLEGQRIQIVFAAALRYLRLLGYEANLVNVFRSPGISSQLKKSQIFPSGDEIQITKSRPGLDVATLRYFWREYPPLRAVLIEWLKEVTKMPEATRETLNRIATVLVEMARDREPDRLFTTVSAWITDAGPAQAVAVAAMRIAAVDGDLQTPTAAKMWAWARTENIALHRVVAETCGHEFGRRYPRRALVRLKWILNSDDATSQDIAGVALRSLACGGAELSTIIETISIWQTDEPVAAARALVELVKLGLSDPSAELVLQAAADGIDIRRKIIDGWRQAATEPKTSQATIVAVQKWAADIHDDVPHKDVAYDILRDVLRYYLNSNLGSLTALSGNAMLDGTYGRLLDDAFDSLRARNSPPEPEELSAE